MANELHQACEQGDLEQVKALIANDSSLINQPNTIHGTYPIFVAALQGHLNIVRYLLDLPSTKTADPLVSCYSLLFYCCRCETADKRNELLDFIYANSERCQF